MKSFISRLKSVRLFQRFYGFFLLLKTILPLCFVILLSIVLVEHYQIQRSKYKRAKIIMAPVQKDFALRIGSINQSLDTIINNFTKLRNEINFVTNLLSGHLGKSADQVGDMIGSVERDIEEFVENSTGDVRKVYENILKDIRGIKLSINLNFNGYINKIMAIKAQIEHVIYELKRLKTDLLNYLEPLNSVVGTIADAVDFFLPFDVSLPSLPSLPSFPDLGIAQFVDDIKSDFRKLAEDTKAKVEKHKRAIVDVVDKQKDRAAAHVEKYSSEIDDMITSTTELLQFDFLKSVYWKRNFISPGKDVFAQIQELGLLTSATYSRLESQVFDNSMRDKSFQRALKEHRNKLNVLIFLTAFWGVILFINYLLGFVKNFRLAIQLMLGQETT